MPSSTFFRLPEEKRERLISAAWEEFTRVRIADASINRIILKARIPRGSFYQYFKDKDDLFSYLVQGVREEFVSAVIWLLDSCEGDLFRVPLYAFDILVRQHGKAGELHDRCIRLFQINPGIDLRRILIGTADNLTGPLMEHIDTGCFRRKDPAFAEQAFAMLLMVAASVAVEVLNNPEQREAQRELLAVRTEIVRCGCVGE